MTSRKISNAVRVESIEWAHDSRDRQYRRLPRSMQLLPVGTPVVHVEAGGRTVYRVVEGPAMDQELVLVSTGPA